MRACVRLVISGRVQGVGYRAWFADEARRNALAGWVRNCRDGTVEAVVAGERTAIDAMAEASRHGPWGSRVTSVEIADVADEGWTDLSIRSTA